MSYNKLPFTEGYSFPWLNFLIISGFGLFVCTANWVVYHQVKLPEYTTYHGNLTARLALQFGSTLVFYTLLYILVINITLVRASTRLTS